MIQAHAGADAKGDRAATWLAARLRSATRRAADLAPERARRVGRVVVDATRGVPPQRGRDVALPADVADREALASMLADTDVFQSAEEGRSYIAEAIDRFRITMALLPDLPPGARVLELGSNPYFLTRLLRRRGLDVTSANYFGDRHPPGRQRQVVHSAGREEIFEFDHFNIETDIFPYGEGTFDLVLCCEILEHLPADPVHMLTEVHRVLRKQTGALLLTTPNATRLENLYKLYRGENVYEHLSGYGPYGRHNRVYTVDEVRDLLDGCGFVEVDVFDMDIHDHTAEWALFPPGARRSGRGCNIFAVARAGREARWRYPSWLFVSTHALRRIVRPDVVMGVNCDLQSAGFHALERMNESFGRWMGAEPHAEVVLDVPPDADTLCIEGLPVPPGVVDVELHAQTDGWSATWTTLPHAGPYTLAAPFHAPSGPCTVRLRSTPWSPAASGINADTRTLGAFIRRVAAVPRSAVPAEAVLPTGGVGLGTAVG